MFVLELFAFSFLFSFVIWYWKGDMITGKTLKLFLKRGDIFIFQNALLTLVFRFCHLQFQEF